MSSSNLEVDSSRNTNPFNSPSQQNFIAIEEIYATITELQLILMEHHRNELTLRTTMHTQAEQLIDLKTSLDVERARNQRLAKLIRRVDSSTSSSLSSLSFGSDEESSGSMEYTRWCHSRPTIDTVESISTLLMQNRFQEISVSYKKCHRQLAKKDAKLTETQCELEMLQSKYERLMEDYKDAQQRVEQLCCKYLRLYAIKNREIFKLKEALGNATQCIMKESSFGEDEKDLLRRNLQFFIRSLRNSVYQENKYLLE